MTKKTKGRTKNGSPRCNLEKKAQQIIIYGVILDLGHGRFKVSSQSQNQKFYDVCFLDDWSCTYPYHINRHTNCKHIIAIQCLVMKVPYIVPVDIELKAPVILCPNKRCGSSDCSFYMSRPRKKAARLTGTNATNASDDSPTGQDFSEGITLIL